MLRNFEDQSVVYALDFKGVKNGGKTLFELDIDDGTNNLRDFTSLNVRASVFSLGGSFSGASAGSLLGEGS
jgi:hypothetical protein